MDFKELYELYERERKLREKATEELTTERALREKATEDLTTERALREKETEVKMKERALRDKETREKMKERAMRLKAEGKLESIRFISRTKTSIYNEFSAKAKYAHKIGFVLPDIDQDLLEKAWRSILLKKKLLGDATSECDQVHPFISHVLEIVLGLFSGSNLKHHQELILRNPEFSPDFVLSPAEFSRPGWLESYGYIECKSSKQGGASEGGGQAISYLATAIYSNTHLNSSLDRAFKFAAFTNGHQIQFFYCKDNEFSAKICSPLLDLCPIKSKRNLIPRGLIYLCKMISLTANSKFPDSTIVVGKDTAQIDQTFQRSESVIVAAGDFGDGQGPCLIKKAINDNKNGKFLIRKEALMYNILKDIPAIRTLEVSPRSLPDCLVLKDIGITLKSWSHDLLFSSALPHPDAQARFITCIGKVLEQIRFLHEQGFTHGDIRPANVIVLDNETPCLIDFVTATRIGASLEWIHGTVMYMADDVLRAETIKPFVFKPVHDLEALAYTILDCIDSHCIETFLRAAAVSDDIDSIEVESSYCSTRQSFISVLEAHHNDRSNPSDSNNDHSNSNHDHFTYPDLVSIFFSFMKQIKKLKQEPPRLTSEEYQDLMAIFTLDLA